MKDTDQEDPLGIPPEHSQDEVRSALKITVITVIVVIFVTIASISYIIISNLEDTDYEDTLDGCVEYTLDQGDGNMTSGCLFTIQKGFGDVLIEDYYFQVGKENGTMLTLNWPQDANTTAYSIDSGLKEDDDKWWNHTERIGFDASLKLKAQNIVDGDTIEVEIINIETNEVVFSGSFTYRD